MKHAAPMEETASCARGPGAWYLRAAMSAVRARESVEVASAISDVWTVIVDTDRMNRIMGMRPVRYVALPEGASGAARFHAHTTLGGVPVTYEEAPFEWTLEKEFGVFRKFLGGPYRSVSTRWTLEPLDEARGGGTRVTMQLDIEPRSRVFAPLAWVGSRQALRAFARFARGIDEHLADDAAKRVVEPVEPANVEAIERGVVRLRERGVRPALAERLGTHLAKCDDADASRIRPYELADEWGVPRRELLTALLHAVPSGLVELRWSILCPSCRTESDQVPTLDEVTAEGHCQMCDIAFELDLDRAVEATFATHPSVRVVPKVTYCIGGPSRTPHVLVQAIVPARSSRALSVPLGAGRYRLFVRGGGRGTLEVREGAPDRAKVVATADAVMPAITAIASGGTLEVDNEDASARHVKLELLEYASAAATAHDVSMLEEFRTIFSTDLLKRSTPLKVSRVALLFSDLTGSTALYAKVGDAAAFRLVDDHFDVLRAVIKERDGVVIKTMGDAIMASFPDERACARAAVACLSRFEEFRRSAKYGEDTHIKIGFFAGPCYVITANGALDYFGQTVNVASRLQHLAASGEVVMPADEAARLEAGGRELVVSAPENVRVKGVEHDLAIVRVALAK